MANAKDFLLEIGTEPMPARFIAPALEQLERGFVELAGTSLEFKSLETLGTLRRLSLIVRGIPEKAAAKTEETLAGPPARMLKDAAGDFTPQAIGFAKKSGIKVEQLTVENTAKGETIVAKVKVAVPSTAERLAEISGALIQRLEFPKTLEWEPSRFRFGRPIRSLAVLYGKSVLPLSVAGIKSGRFTRGLAALGKKPFSVTEPAKYREQLRREFVLADAAERREDLLKKLEGAARRTGYAIELDEELLTETVYMTEYPTPVPGAFKKDFLELPAQLLSMVLKKQLKFFPMRGPAGMAPSFIGVRDGRSEGQELVREGYQRVLTARLSDAAFFYNRDRASRLESKLPLLERVSYQKDLGSVSQKADRVASLSEWLCETLRQVQPLNEGAVRESARLCYADLVTDVVKEFPELQGVMGGVYARHDGYDERVALSLEQFYYPTGGKSPVPTTLEGAVVSLAGKLDSLAGSFAVGMIPTGSADPFALRRQALGAVRILLEKQLRVDLEKALARALLLQPVNLDENKRAELLRQLADFIWGRAQSFFEEMGFKIDEIRSVRADGLRDLPRALKRMAAVRALRAHPDFEPLAASFKRATNILKQAKLAPEQAEAPERDRLEAPSEKDLFDVLCVIEGGVQECLVHDDFEAGLRQIVSVKPRLDRFFEDVLVMAPDEALRRQRLGLVAKLARLFTRVADLSEIQGATPEPAKVG